MSPTRKKHKPPHHHFPESGVATKEQEQVDMLNGIRERPGAPVRRVKKQTPILLWVDVVVLLLVAGGVVAHFSPHITGKSRIPAKGSLPQVEYPKAAGPALSLAEIQAQKLIVDVHEHIGGADLAPMYLKAMDEFGIGKMCLMGSSKFTLTLDEKYGFTGYDENDEELLKIVHNYPGRFEAWVTINPTDPDKLDHLKDYVARGATGLKLYIGHGYVKKSDGEYMFHPVAMDDPGMLPVYQFCAENFLMVCIHVNPSDVTPGFAQEIVAVLSAFPDMKVDCPHFALSSIKDERLRELLDVFPNLYTDVSFGDFFMKDGLARISKSPHKFRKLFADYPKRIMYATDLVLTKGPGKDEDWIRTQHKAYLDMLSKDEYTTKAVPGVTLHGLALPDHILDRVLYRNFEEFSTKKPKGTKITREIDWSQMNVTKLDRKPGQAFPPSARKKKGLGD